jgi:hypothetical protein
MGFRISTDGFNGIIVYGITLALLVLLYFIGKKRLNWRLQFVKQG